MALPLPKPIAALLLAAALSLPARAGAGLIEKVETPPPLVPLEMHAGGRMVTLQGDGGRTLHRFQWPGVYFAAGFAAPEVYFTTGPGEMILHVIVDGRPAVPLVKPDPGVYRVGGLAAGPHTIRIEVVTESQSAPMEFGGFSLEKGRKAGEPPWASRQIEFIGDSYSVGYGNTSQTRTCTPGEVWATTDNSQSFGVLTAKQAGADYQINAISGRGIVRNYDGAPGDPLPVVYPFVLFDQSVATEDLTWQPQVIVIDLGGNDFSTPLHGEKWATREELRAAYERTYVKFVQKIRRGNPGAFFILAADDGSDGEIQAEVQKVIGQLQAAGEKRVAFVPFGKLELTGCDWHPSLADHRAMAATLTQFLAAHPDLWQGR